MNFSRYMVFAAISIALHAVVVVAMPAQEPITISTEKAATAVNIQLVSIPAPKLDNRNKTDIQPTKTKSTETKSETVPKPQETKKAPQVKKSFAEKKPDVTKESTKKVESKRAKKLAVKKKQASTDLTDMSSSRAAPITKKLKPQKSELVKKENNNEPSTTSEHPKKASKTEVIKDTRKTYSSMSPDPAITKSQSNQPQLINKPSFTAKPSPIRYPRAARKRGYEGKVVVEIWLDESGLQTRQFVQTSSGHELLDKTALAAIAKWKFNSYQVGGQKVSHRVRIPVNFKLD